MQQISASCWSRSAPLGGRWRPATRSASSSRVTDPDTDRTPPARRAWSPNPGCSSARRGEEGRRRPTASADAADRLPAQPDGHARGERAQAETVVFGAEHGTALAVARAERRRSGGTDVVTPRHVYERRSMTASSWPTDSARARACASKQATDGDSSPCRRAASRRPRPAVRPADRRRAARRRWCSHASAGDRRRPSARGLFDLQSPAISVVLVSDPSAGDRAGRHAGRRSRPPAPARRRRRDPPGARRAGQVGPAAPGCSQRAVVGQSGRGPTPAGSSPSPRPRAASARPPSPPTWPSGWPGRAALDGAGRPRRPVRRRRAAR